MRPVIPKALTLFFPLFILFNINSAFAQEPTIATCEGTQFYCLIEDHFDLCVEITVNPLFTDPIDRFEIDWGDGSPIRTIPFSNNPPQQFHHYDLEDFFMTCTFSEEYFVRLTSRIVDNDPLVNIFPVTFRNPPKASFSLNPSVICAGNEACFTSSSCPIEGLTIINWDYGNGNTGLDDCQVYDQVGSFDIVLSVENDCGTDTQTETLNVIAPPIADAIVVSGVVDPDADTLVVCLGGGGAVELDGSQFSENENTYLWNAPTLTMNYDWMVDPPSQNNPSVDDPTIIFLKPGIFSVVLAVDNNCLQPSYDTLIFDVLDAESLQLPNQPDACLTLNYSPVLNANATYTFNGSPVVQSDFPMTLGIDSYTLECTLDNVCGLQVQSDFFEVTPQEMVSINAPINDTIVCQGTALILLQAEPEGGTWSGSPHIVVIGYSTWFDPAVHGPYTLTYGKGADACRDEQLVNINVDGVPITAIDYEKCEDSENFLLVASPDDGTWSSVDCPACIENDSFIIAEMIALGLTAVNVNYEVTTNLQCDGMSTITVSLSTPIANFSAQDTFCLGVPVMLNFSNTVANEVMWMIDGQLSANPPFTGLSAGDHTIQLIAKNGDCRDSTQQLINITAPPGVLDFNPDYDQSGCAELEVVLNPVYDPSANLDYQWFLNGTLFSTVADPGSIILSQGLNDTTYTIGYGSANSCGAEIVEMDIVVFPQPTVNFGTNFNEYCSGDTIFFGNMSYGNPTQILWDFGNGNTSTNFDPGYQIYFTDTSQSTFQVSLIGMNNCGTDTIVQEVIINPTDVNAFFNTNQSTVCVGEEICFQNFSTFGSSVLYDFGDGNTSADPNPCYSYNSSGTYTVTLKAFGCGFDSTFTTIEVLAIPEVTIDQLPSACPGEPIDFNANVMDVLDFEWDFGDGFTSSLMNPIHSFSNPGNYTIQLTGTSLNGCEKIDEVNLTIVTPPIADFTTDLDSLCTGSTIYFINNSMLDVAYCLWDFGDGNTSILCNPANDYSIENNYTVRLIVQNIEGCADTTEQLIYIFSEPSPTFDINQNGPCSPATIELSNGSTNAQSYNWDFGNGETSDETNPELIYAQGDTFNIQLTALNGLCSRSASQEVIVLQTPEPIASLSTNAACAPSEILFDAIIDNNIAQSNLDFLWDFDDGTTSFQQSVSHPFEQPRDYLVSLITTSYDLCSDTLFEPITIFEPVIVSSNTTDILCYNESTGAIDLTIDNGTGPFEFQWSNGVAIEDQINIPSGIYAVLIADSNDCTWGDSIEIFQPDEIIPILESTSTVSCFDGVDGAMCIQVSGGVGDYNITWNNGAVGECIENLSAGNYPVLITDENNCQVATSFDLDENPLITVEDSISNITCYDAADGSIRLDTILGGFSNIYATILNGPIDYQGGQFFPNLIPGNYILTITDLNNCSVDLEYKIAEPDPLWVDIEKDTIEIGLGDSVELVTNHNADQPNFFWSPAQWLSCADCEDPWSAPWNDIYYELELMDENGCLANDAVFLKVNLNRDYYVPNTFTPNADGRNDLFCLRTRLASIKSINTFRIFDRWGELVFEKQNVRPQEENPEDAWNGRFRGELLAPDVFTYHIVLEYVDGEKEAVTGTVNLIR